MDARHAIGLSAIAFVASCTARDPIETCEIGKVAVHPLQSGPHHSVANGTNSQNGDPEDDFTDLEEGLFTHGVEYWTTIRVGGKDINVVADTGSSDLVLPDHVYTPGPTAINQRTQLKLGYGSCNGMATQYEDSVGLTCGAPVALSFAYATGGNCPSILGLAYPSLSKVCQDVQVNCPTCTCTFFGDLVARGGVQNLFSMLLCGARSGSQLILGGQIANAPLSAITYTAIPEENYYTVVPIDMRIKGGGLIGTFSPDIIGTPPFMHYPIVDSGTTLTVIPDAWHDQIATAIQQVNPNLPLGFFQSTKPSETVFTLSSRELGDTSKFPTITLTMTGYQGAPNFTLEMPPSTYLKRGSDHNYMFGFRKLSTSNSPQVVFGQTLMENYYVVFDRANKRIGFAPSATLCGE